VPWLYALALCQHSWLALLLSQWPMQSAWALVCYPAQNLILPHTQTSHSSNQQQPWLQLQVAGDAVGVTRAFQQLVAATSSMAGKPQGLPPCTRMTTGVCARDVWVASTTAIYLVLVTSSHPGL
jgi:hypothetical protein